MRIFKLKREKPPEILDRSKGWKERRADQMRENPTPSEKLMIDLLTENGIVFQCQVLMLGYIADFYFRHAKSIIEVDGSSHRKRREYDRHRDQVFQDHGFRVLRVKDNDLIQDPQSVLTLIQAYLKNGRGKVRKAKKKRGKLKRWQDVPKLSKNHLPTKKA